MVFTSCPNCRAQINDQAPACPQCGAPRMLAPPKKGLGTGAIIAIVLAVIFVGGGGIFAVLAIYGTRSYIANAKAAEAKNSISQMAKDAISGYESEGATGKTHHLCPSASASVPPSMAQVRGMKYQSSSADWMKDAPRNAGFACLKFEMIAPQYFQYSYTATATEFTATAHGDLNGDGVASTFQIKGHVVGDKLVVDPTITETNPKE